MLLAITRDSNDQPGFELTCVKLALASVAIQLTVRGEICHPLSPRRTVSDLPAFSVRSGVVSRRGFEIGFKIIKALRRADLIKSLQDFMSSQATLNTQSIEQM